MNLPSHLKDPAQTKHQRLYDTVNSLIDFLEEKFPQPDEPKCFDGECNHDDCCGKIPENCKHKKSDEPKYVKVDKDMFKNMKLDIKVIPSGRIDYCVDCDEEHGYDCPKDTPHWESDYAAIWERYFDNKSFNYLEEEVRQDILELIHGLMK
jgi:hypothetical protein